MKSLLREFIEAVNAWLIIALLLAAPLVCASEADDRALFDACRNGDAAAVTELLKKGANPNAVGERGRTPLMIAGMNGQTAAVRALLAFKADSNAKDNDGQTALSLSGSMGQTDTVAVLKEAGIANNPVEASFRQLAGCITRGDAAGAQQLVAAEPQLKVRLKRGFASFALVNAVKSGNTNMVKFLLENGAYVNTTMRNMKTVLMIAVEGDHFGIAKALVENGASVNAITETDDISALRLAEGKPQFEALLKAHGATEKSYELNAAYQQAVKAEDVDMVRALLKKGADVNGSPWDDSPLVRATRQNNAELVKILLAAKADVNRGADAAGRSALAIYTENPKPDPAVIAKFIESGAPLDADVVRSTFGQFKPDPELALALLRNADVRPYFQDPLHSGQFVSWLAETGRKDLMEALLATGFDPNWTDKFGVEGEPLIAKAALAGNPETVELLVAKGVSVNSSNRFGLTLVYLAALNRQTNVVKFLIEKNADTNPTFDMEVDADRARKYETRGVGTP